MSGFRDASGLRQIAGISIRDADNVLRTVSSAYLRTAAGTLRKFFGSMSAVAAPATKRAFGNSTGTLDITVSPVEATVTGGAAPFTYLWERTDAGGESWTITVPTGAITGFTAEDVPPGETITATFKCTVTDAATTEAETNEVTATAVNLGGGL
jgi:hypothetical protein